MMRRALAVVALSMAVLAGASSVVLAQELPQAAAERHPLFEPLLPLIGKTFRGANVTQAGVEDVNRWEWAVAGRAVRVTHAVNGGVYGGETLFFPDKDSGRLIFHYFTTGGFHTTGWIAPNADGSLSTEETVHGADGIELIRAVIRIGPDGYQTRALQDRDGQMVEFGGFDYREDSAATVALPSGN